MENMGSRHSSEAKPVDNTGTVTNSVTLNSGERQDVFSIELILLVAILVALRIAEFMYFLNRIHNKKMKKKYATNPINQA